MKRILFIIALGSSALLQAQDTISMTLSEAFNYAKQHNGTYLNAQKDVLLSNETVRQTVAIGLPQISATGSYQQFLTVPGSWIKNFVTAPGAPDYIFLKFQQEFVSSANVAVNQLLWDGSYLVGLQATGEFVKMSKLAEAKSLRDLENNISKAYITAVSTQKNLDLIETNMRLLERSLFEVSQLNKEGFAEKLDVERLELNLANLKLQRQKLQNAILVTVNLLKMQMGMPMETQLKLSNNLDQLESTINLSDADVSNFSSANRIENRLLEQAIILSKLDQKRYKFSALPSLFAFYQHQESTQRPEFNFFKSNLTVNNSWVPSDVWGLSLRMPIYGGGATRSKIRETPIKIEKAQNDLSTFQRYATLEYQNSKNTYLQNLQSVEIQKQNLALAQKIYDKSMAKFKEGVGSTLEITQAEAELRTANNAYLNSLYDLLVSKIELKSAIGQSINQ